MRLFRRKIRLTAFVLFFLSLTARSQSRFTPSHAEYFKQALKNRGPVTAVLGTTDRLMRDTRIGLASNHYLREDGKIHEDFFGPLPYGLDFPSFDLGQFSRVSAHTVFNNSEIEFVEYLLGNNFSRDAVYYLHGSGFVPSDTLHYYKALSLYTAGDLHHAAESFKKVSRGSVYFEPSVFLNAACDAYTSQYDSARSLLLSYEGARTELKSYELAALSLLQDDKQGYQTYSKDFTYSNYSLSQGEKMFDQIYSQRFSSPRRNPWVAAGLSTIVPGLGKIYNGNYGEGAVSLLLVGSFAGFAAESWIRNGGGDWRTILFTSIASLLHLSNIYGSYISVGLYNSYLKDAQNQTIVFYIHYPVRNFFR